MLHVTPCQKRCSFPVRWTDNEEEVPRPKTKVIVLGIHCQSEISLIYGFHHSSQVNTPMILNKNTVEKRFT